MKELPNMGEQPKAASNEAAKRDAGGIVDGKPSSATPNSTSASGWTSGLGRLLWTKWHWGLLLAFAVVVSRLTGTK
jgi:ubiquitin-conjugating enzyme E2 J2